MCLFHLPLFKQKIEEFYLESRTHNTTIRELSLLFEKLQHKGFRNEVVSVEDLYDSLPLDIKTEHDVLQLYSNLIAWILDFISSYTKKDTSFKYAFTPITLLGKMFMGCSGFSISCKDQNCYSSYSINNWRIPCITIENNQPVNELVKQWHKQEYDLNYNCLQCNSTTVSVKQNFEDSLPEVLNIKIKRLAQNGEKITTPVSIQEDLVVTTFFNITKSYKLFAVVSHIGTYMTGGIYVSYINVDLESWWKFDHRGVSKYSFVDILLNSDETPYSLIYVSQDLIAARPHLSTTYQPITISPQTPQAPRSAKKTWPICKNCKKENDPYLFCRRCAFCKFDND